MENSMQVILETRIQELESQVLRLQAELLVAKQRLETEQSIRRIHECVAETHDAGVYP